MGSTQSFDGPCTDARGQPIIHPLSMFSDTPDSDIRLSDMRILVSFKVKSISVEVSNANVILMVLLLLRTTLPRITRSAPFPPVSSRGTRSCRVLVSLPISTTEETHETRCRVGPLASFSSLYYEGVYMFLI
jgi:hypothetical protein